MTRTGAEIAGLDVFRWHPDARLFVQGQEAPDGAGPASAVTRDVMVLRDAIRSGDEYLVSPEGISVIGAGTRGFVRLRSGGTTGAPKTIRRSHRSWIANFETNAEYLGLDPADTYGVLGLPVHSLALYAIAEAAHVGADIQYLGGLGPRRQVRLLAEAGATVLYATPTQLRLLVATGVALPTVRLVLCGGGGLPETLREQIAAFCPAATFREFYGAAETSFIAWGDGKGPSGAVGRAYPGVEIRIAPSEGDFGEIWVRSPYLFEAYVEGDSALTRREDGFLTLGEMGALDGAGYLRVAGRRNRMVTIADQNVFPEEIEAWFLSHPEIIHCAVLPRLDTRGRHRLVAVIGNDLTPERRDALLAECRVAFGTLVAPRRVLVLSDFPETAAGKPDLTKIAARLEAIE